MIRENQFLIRYSLIQTLNLESIFLSKLHQIIFGKLNKQKEGKGENMRSLPSPIPLFNNTPQANQIALDRLRASSSVPSVLANLNLPKGENRSSKYRTSATTCTDTITRIQRVLLNGCKKETRVDDLEG